MQVGTSEDTANQLAPQAELMPRAFEKCTALRHLDLGQSEHNTPGRTRCLPECCFLHAGITSLSLPPNFNWMGPAACERCLQLQQVNLSSAEVTEIMGSAFAHCKHLQSLRLPHKLRIIEQEAFLKCTSLTEVSVPPTLLYIARRAFAGCTRLSLFQRVGKRRTWRGTYSRANAFLKCDNLDMPQWVRWLPRMRINGRMTPLKSSIRGKLLEMHAAALTAGTRVLALSTSKATPLECPPRKLPTKEISWYAESANDQGQDSNWTD